jgi:diaminobutyrate-2-oxoglutarate transaminase
MDPALAVAIQQHCFKQGLLLERGGRQGNVIRLLPPLNLKPQEAGDGISKIEEVVKSLA